MEHLFRYQKKKQYVIIALTTINEICEWQLTKFNQNGRIGGCFIEIIFGQYENIVITFNSIQKSIYIDNGGQSDHTKNQVSFHDWELRSIE